MYIEEGKEKTRDDLKCRYQIESRQLEAWQHRVRVLCPDWTGEVATVDAAREVLQKQGNDSVGFLQVFNPHLQCSKCRELVCSETLGLVAAQFLDAGAVRRRRRRKGLCNELV